MLFYYIPNLSCIFMVHANNADDADDANDTNDTSGFYII